MKTALKYYFKYVPKYYFISLLIQTVVVALLSLGDSVLVPSIVAAYFAETVEINVVIIAILSLLFVNIAYVCIIKIIEHRTVPKLNRDFSKGINMLLFTKTEVENLLLLYLIKLKMIFCFYLKTNIMMLTLNML